MKVALGGDRLRSEQKMDIYLHGYGRSSHNVGKIIRTTQACGTLVPYWCQLGMDGTTFYVNLTTKIKTLPTTGPVFGSFKHQIDIFKIPIRLYIAALHNNALGVGLNMSKVLLPVFEVAINQGTSMEDNQNLGQIDPSALIAYLGIRGWGHRTTVNPARRKFPAIFLLAYWDIYKNYYSNKQEGIGVAIEGLGRIWNQIQWGDGYNWGVTRKENSMPELNITDNQVKSGYYIKLIFPEKIGQTEVGEITFLTNNPNKPTIVENGRSRLGDGFLFQRTDPEAPGIKDVDYPNRKTNVYMYKILKPLKFAYNASAVGSWPITTTDRRSIQTTTFALSNIDDMRKAILKADETSPFQIPTTATPYNIVFTPKTLQMWNTGNYVGTGSWYSQAGMGIKTHLSDRFNNWLSTEWVDGTSTGINEITAVDVSDGKLTMDALILAKKIYSLLNRVAISDGSYHAWRQATYGVRSATLPESPIFCGGMQSEIVFDEIVSNAATEDEPLGTLAGKGADRMHKSGRSIKISCDEPSMIMAIGSITPRPDYSQGNKWWNRLKTMDDFHKPELDAIGFQELIADEMLASDTQLNYATGETTTHSVGRQPSWIEYMTDVNETFGDFAAGMPLEFMAVNRVYDEDEDGMMTNATTYIDPEVYNQIFADASLSAQNFWVQVAIDATARRVMSAKQIPNL